MQTGMVIKWAHRSITAILVIIITAMAINFYLTHKPYDDRLYRKQQLSDSVWLYITQYQHAGATDTDVYRYYLNHNITGDPLKALTQTSPFMTADRPDAIVNALANKVTVRITGKIYSFSNSVFFYDDKVAVMPVVDLYASGVNSWR
ncbi:hypothetical protein [Winslowiella iniecta]|uniref:Uncharacterized protein n=1 Tax=Winslowiella iniecta TaxID=1560201 RepID=A0A0L7TFZ2_9GAMM|nr:hypothetical protein [Winslowiella iniecta]KOC90928.1 hypothetical protein NG42_07275 [Winslowiella iniecta]KOC94292.1 hypothetical protein NG43_06350 [Winslowiella iniecta]